MKAAKRPRTEMPTQPPMVRIQNYLEVALGYSDAEAKAEAARCIQCKKPTCRKGCPVEIDIKGFIGLLSRYTLRPFAWYRLALAPLVWFFWPA